MLKNPIETSISLLTAHVYPPIKIHKVNHSPTQVNKDPQKPRSLKSQRHFTHRYIAI